MLGEVRFEARLAAVAVHPDRERAVSVEAQLRRRSTDSGDTIGSASGHDRPHDRRSLSDRVQQRLQIRKTAGPDPHEGF